MIEYCIIMILRNALSVIRDEPSGKDTFMKDYFRYKEENDRPAGGFKFYLYNIYGTVGLSVPLHWHEEIEILYPNTEGELILDGSKISFGRNDILFVNSRQLHSTYLTKEGWAYYILVHPDLLCAHSIFNKKNEGFHFPEKINGDTILCRQIMDDIVRIPAPISDKNKFFVMNRLFGLLYYLADNGYPITECESNRTYQTGYIKGALEYIHQNIRHKIAIRDIADEVGISKEYLMRLFKLYTGETVNAYVRARRLEAAKDDLAGGYSLTEVVYRYEYSDTAYFCRLFKKQYGVSPGKYKEKLERKL